MNIRKVFRLLTIVAVCSCFSGIAVAEINGILKMCSMCHGENGIGTKSDVPTIAGIPAIVQEAALFAYLDGDRDCGTTPMMCSVISNLSEDQLVELAEHFGAMPYVPAEETYDAAMADTGRTIHLVNCAICHGQEDPGDAQASILHGQRKDYLRYALQQYAEGKRQQLPAMESKTAALSDEDIEALLNYYASYPN